LRLSGDLAGRAAKISPDVPRAFDAPLAHHHRIIGQWLASREPERLFTRAEARRHIEDGFRAAVMELLAPVKLTNLRVVVLVGDGEIPPAIAVICDDIGQLELGWIEKTNVLSDTLFGSVAPVGWRAAAYKALTGTLGSVLTLFNYEDMFEEFSAYHWDGATTDEEARAHLIESYGVEVDEAEEMLPSTMNAKRPDFMIARPDPLKAMPKALRSLLRRLKTAFEAHRAARTGWLVENFGRAVDYFPHLDEASHLPSLTLVPFDHFQRELDEVGRHGMEMGFMDVAGLCELPEAAVLDTWFESFRLGLDVLLAAQELIDFDPTKPEARA
jgi:hypothetical protein